MLSWPAFSTTRTQRNADMWLQIDLPVSIRSVFQQLVLTPCALAAAALPGAAALVPAVPAPAITVPADPVFQSICSGGETLRRRKMNDYPAQVRIGAPRSSRPLPAAISRPVTRP